MSELLPEDAQERAAYERDVATHDNDRLGLVCGNLRILSYSVPQGGSLAPLLAIMSNELAVLHHNLLALANEWDEDEHTADMIRADELRAILTASDFKRRAVRAETASDDEGNDDE